MSENSLTLKRTVNKPVSDFALDQLFREARTYNDFEDRPVSDALLQSVYDLMKMGATSANCLPARVLFLTSNESKKRLEPFLDEGNRAKTMLCPCVAIITYDLEFTEKLPKLMPHTDAKSWFEGNQALIEETAIRNGTLQGAYLMLAARALGLDCGPMSGFDSAGVKKEFFPDQPVIPNFLCNLGYGTEKNLFPRLPRLDFAEACKIL
ncbi:MAG: malonic semialdehyde reductase [bacterium]